MYSEPSAPSLPMELAEPVLVWLLRHATFPLARGSAAPIHAPLNVLSRTLVPDVTRAALVKLWWYSLGDIPPRDMPWLFAMVLELEHCAGRPLEYTVADVGRAARRGDFATLDAWLDAGLLDDDEWAKVARYARWWSDLAKRVVSDLGDGVVVAQYMAVREWWHDEGSLPWDLPAYGPPAPALLPADEEQCLQALEWWRVQDESLTMAPKVALVEASHRGYLRVLEWCSTHYAAGVECTREAMNAATEGGHLRVLDWWITKLPLKGPRSDRKTVSAIKNVADLASRGGHVHILQWWLEATSSPGKAYRGRTEAAVDEAAARGYLGVLDFWLARTKHPCALRRIAFKYHHAVGWGTAAGQVAVIEWFGTRIGTQGLRYDSCPLLHWPHKHARTISIDCLDARLRHGIHTHFSPAGMTLLSRDGRLDVLEWIASHRIRFEVGSTAEPLVEASQNGHVGVLDWWLKQLGNDKLVELAATASEMSSMVNVSVLEWWANKGITLPASNDGMVVRSFRNRNVVARLIAGDPTQANAVIRQCITLCMSHGDYAMLHWCFSKYPFQVRDALKNISLSQVQFGMLEFLKQVQVNPEYTLSIYFLNSVCDYRKFRYQVAKVGGLGLLEWAEQELSGMYGDRPASEFAIPHDDWNEARAQGDLGYLRWAKKKQMAVYEETYQLSLPFGGTPMYMYRCNFPG